MLIPNLSSAMAINKLKDLKASNNNISCSTCDYYLFFDSGFIADGDTRFKDSPPIRDNENK